MSLILSTNSHAYINARNHWINETSDLYTHVFTTAPEAINDFHHWLKKQGVSINQQHYMRVVIDSMGVAIGIDTMEFDTDANKLIFLLRWS